jgi:hypothetical protein
LLSGILILSMVSVTALLLLDIFGVSYGAARHVLTGNPHTRQ